VNYVKGNKLDLNHVFIVIWQKNPSYFIKFEVYLLLCF